MNNQLAAKMATIQNYFEQAGVNLPVTSDRYEIKPMRFAGSKGIKVKGRFVWGVTPREYWSFLKAQN